MFQHRVDDHRNEYLEQLIQYFTFIFAAVGPPLLFVVDWIIPFKFMFRCVRDLVRPRHCVCNDFEGVFYA